jgi:hypothetical protein
MSCEAIKMLPSRPVSDGDVYVERLASPATIDCDRMKFGSRCWMPFKKDIPLLYRHQPDRVAGRILELNAIEQGLFVVWSSPTAKRSVAHTSASPAPSTAIRCARSMIPPPRTHL